MSQEILIITSEKERKKLNLDHDVYVIGRSSTADIRIDDPKASRKHAAIERKVDGWQVSDLESTNGTFIEGKKITSTSLVPGMEFAIGSTSFMLDPGRASIHSLTTRPGKGSHGKGGLLFKIVAAFIIVILTGSILFFMLKDEGKDTITKPEGVSVVPLDTEETKRKLDRNNSKESAIEQKADPSVSIHEQKSSLSMEYYRQGLLFYENGNLKKAVEKWDMALAQDRDNRLARKKLAKALRKLNEEVEKHYQAGLMHLKYMRFREAEQEFTIVVELSRNQSDRRYLDAINKLNQLKTK